MKILHIAETAKGGVGTYIGQLASIQATKFGNDCVRILLPAEHAFQAGEQCAPLISTFDREGRSLRALCRFAAEIRATVQAFRPDVIHAHSTFAGLMVRLLFRWRRRHHRPAIVYCPHGWAFDISTSPATWAAYAAVERGLASWCDRIVVISDYERDRARRIGIPGKRLAVVKNGISDIPAAPPAIWHDDRLKVVFIGRFDHQKGVDILIDAVEPHADRICVRMIGDAVVGAGQLRKVPGQIETLGWLDAAAIGAQLAAADLVVVPSRWEGFGLVALEAMRAGRMVIASNVGGLREVVVNGVTGRLVTPGTPVELTAAMLADTPERRREMGMRGRERFLENFTAERMACEIEEVYRSISPEPARQTAPVGAPISP